MWNSLKDLLQQRKQDSSWSHNVEVAQAVETATQVIKQLLPPELEGEFSVLHIHNHILTVRVSHPGIAQILQQQTQRCLVSLPKTLSVQAIKTVIGVNSTE